MQKKNNQTCQQVRNTKYDPQKVSFFLPPTSVYGSTSQQLSVLDLRLYPGSEPQSLSAIQSLVPGYNGVVKLYHQRGALVPVSGDLSREATVREDGLHDASGEGRAVQAAVLFGNGDVRVDEWVFLYDVIGLVVVVGLLQLVSLLPK